MGLSGIHQKKNSTEMWCIFRIGDSDLSETKKCTCCKNDLGNGVGADGQEKPDADQCLEEKETNENIEDTQRQKEDMDDSFCSYRSSTTTMDQGELAEQLALVQDMVQEMKNGFTTAMEELAKIQFGDQNLQQQIANDRQQMTEEVQALRSEVQSLAQQMKTVTETQKTLEDKVDSIQNFNLLEQLQQLGILNEQSRLQPEKTGSLNSSPEKEYSPRMAPMVQPFLGSLQQQQQQQRVVDESDNQSVTAKATKCLNLTQALHEKCLHLDLSVSTDEDDTQVPQYQTHNTQSSYLLTDEVMHIAQKIPPHEKVIEEVQREKIAQEVVDSERSYCSQLWTLIDSYINILKQEEIMGSRDLNSIFPPYIPHLYEQHCIVLRKMEERIIRWKYSNMIGDIFVKLTETQEEDNLSLYKEYISDFPTVINNLNTWFSQSASFREIMRSTSLANCAVIPLLLAPLQQIPKYSLVIKKLLRHTSTDHPDRYYLETALARLNNFLNVMNDELEHGMQLLNMNKSSISRMRDGGNSLRSRSSGSSGEVNQGSSARDSGIHSNGEDAVHRHPASPGTTRRYVLQVLRDRREREALQRPSEKHHSRPVSVPPRTHVPFGGSHPDLTGREYNPNHSNVPPEMPSYMPYQSGHKMYSSLTKIQSLSPEKTAVKKIKIRRRPDSQKLIVNSNYMRPLTPHLPFGGSSSRDTYDHSDSSKLKSAKWNVRHRPASSMDVLTSPERRDRVIENWRLSQQTSLDSPRGHPGEGRARNDFHVSVQKLLAERDSPDDRVLQQEVRVHEHNDYDGHSRTFKPVNENSLPGNENIDDYRGGDLDDRHSFEEGLQQSQDYGIFGDEDSDENVKYESRTPRRRLLPEPIIQGNLSSRSESHQRVLPYVVSQNSQALNSQSLSQEQIAVSLAHSLNDSQVKLDKVESESTASSDRSDSEARTNDIDINLSGEELRHVNKNFNFNLKPENLVPLNNDEVFESSNVSKYEPEDAQKEKDIEKFTYENNTTYVQAEKPSEEEIKKQDNVVQTWANIGKDNEEETKVEIITEKPEVVKRRPLSLKVRQQETGDNASKISNIPSPNYSNRNPSYSNRNSAIEPIQTQTIPAKVRLSQPNLDQMYSSRIPVRPLSPSDGKNANGSTKGETKIPVYSPRKKEKGSKTQRGSSLSKSTEEISKMKKKTPFKDSIKNFFGRKRKTSKYKFKEFSSATDLSEFAPSSPKDKDISLALWLQNSWTKDENRNIPEPLPPYDIVMALRELENQPCSDV